MIGLGIFTHPIGAPLEAGTPIDLQDIVRKVCFDGIIQQRIEFNSVVQRQVSLYGKIQKRMDFVATLRLDC